MYMPQIGERIRFLRTRQNLSQSALAEKLSVSKSVVSSYETGVHLPPYDAAYRRYFRREHRLSSRCILRQNDQC